MRRNPCEPLNGITDRTTPSNVPTSQWGAVPAPSPFDTFPEVVTRSVYPGGLWAIHTMPVQLQPGCDPGRRLPGPLAVRHPVSPLGHGDDCGSTWSPFARGVSRPRRESDRRSPSSRARLESLGRRVWPGQEPLPQQHARSIENPVRMCETRVFDTAAFSRDGRSTSVAPTAGHEIAEQRQDPRMSPYRHQACPLIGVRLTSGRPISTSPSARSLNEWRRWVFPGRSPSGS